MANIIDPTVVIRGDVTLGDGNEILPYAVLIGPLAIGDGNWIGPHVTIGTPGQNTRDPRAPLAPGQRIEIGSRNIIREYTAIQQPCFSGRTVVSDDCFLMQSVHVPHDATLESGVVIAPMAALGGLVHVMEGASIGLSCCVHQRTVIGAYAFVGMGSQLARDVKPFSKYVSRTAPAVNDYAIDKFGFRDVADDIAAYVLEDKPPQSARLAELVARYESAKASRG